MTLTVTCECGKQLRAADRLAGKKVKCPKCGGRMRPIATIIEAKVVTAILDGSLADAEFAPDPIFGLQIPRAVHGVPSEVLRPRDTWKDGDAYDKQAHDLAARFRENEAKFELSDEVKAAGPQG